MSPLDDPQPPAPQQDAFDAERMPAGPAPMSAMAVVGFVSSLMVCCPVLSPLLGLIFSLVGLSQTKGGVRRGRSLALAGLIISIIMVPLHGWGVVAGVNGITGVAQLHIAMIALQQGDADDAYSTLYKLGSPELKSAVSEDEMAEWITVEFDKYGGLQGLLADAVQPFEAGPGPGIFRYRWKAQFPEETITVLTVIRIRLWGQTHLENIIIGDAELIAANDSQPDSGADEEPTNEKSAGDEPTDEKTTGDEPTENEDTDEDG